MSVSLVLAPAEDQVLPPSVDTIHEYVNEGLPGVSTAPIINLALLPEQTVSLAGLAGMLSTDARVLIKLNIKLQNSNPDK